MKRRDFLKNTSLLGAGALMINSVPVQALDHRKFRKFFDDSSNDKILILVQLHGGNDGLNTLIPIGKYSDYYNLRANIAVPDYGARKYIELDPTLSDENRVGVHPDMSSMKAMFDQFRAAAVQGVGYDNMNLSHFRGRDIMFMGGDYNEYYESSWMGRFLDEEYPGYPDNYPNDDMPDPLGLELDNAVSFAFQRENSIPAGISLLNPNAFYDLIEDVGIDPPTETVFPDSYYGDELEYLNAFELKTNQYANRLKAVYMAGSNSSEVTYPTSYPLNTPAPYVRNPLSEQLKIIARLISGGIKTRIFLTRLGGFDTHASQVESYDPSMGRHAALLYHLTTAVKAFHDDLKAQDLENRVLTMTFSEFGRRAASNGSYGTDHGKAAPVLLFGPGLKRKIHGENPDLVNLDGGNLKYQIDYRQVYSSVLLDWLGASPESLSQTGFADYIDNRLDLFLDPLSQELPVWNQNLYMLDNCWPNPVKDQVRFAFHLAARTQVSFGLYDPMGRLISKLVDGYCEAGETTVDADLSKYRSGNYIYKLKSSNFECAKILVVA